MLRGMSYLGVPAPTPLRLSIGASPAGKVFVVCFGIFGLLIAGFIATVAWAGNSMANNMFSGLFPSGVSADVGGGLAQQSGFVGTAFLVFGFCTVPFVLLLGYVVLSTLRRAAWLEGTIVTMRGAVTTKRVDLATAAVQGDSVTYRHSSAGGDGRSVVYIVPALAARDRSTGTSIKIPLRGQGLKRLPSDQLRALAAAMMSRRQPSDPDYQDAAALANSMVTMAANPFPV
jgi:hypothetical protein